LLVELLSGGSTQGRGIAVSALRNLARDNRANNSAVMLEAFPILLRGGPNRGSVEALLWSLEPLMSPLYLS
jgi:hypothetical protein